MTAPTRVKSQRSEGFSSSHWISMRTYFHYCTSISELRNDCFCNPMRPTLCITVLCATLCASLVRCLWSIYSLGLDGHTGIFRHEQAKPGVKKAGEAGYICRGIVERINQTTVRHASDTDTCLVALPSYKFE